MKLHRYVDHQRLHIATKDVISLSISVLLLFRHYISHKITFGAPSSGGVLCSACVAFILAKLYSIFFQFMTDGMLIREIMTDPLLRKYRYYTKVPIRQIEEMINKDSDPGFCPF